jgi:SAM-dependent methyltransferase
MVNDAVWKIDSVASQYLEDVRDSRPFIKEQIEIVLRLISELGPPVRRFIDIGCGDGLLAAAIWQEHPDATGILLDHSPPLLQAARERFQNFAAPVHFCSIDYGQPEWVQAVARYAPVDLIVSGHSIHHQPDEGKRQVYSDIFGLLQPGGMFLNVEHVASPTERLERLWDEIRIDSSHTHALRRGLNKSRAEVETEYRERPDRQANRFALVETQCNWLREIGYTDVDCYFKFFESAVFGGCRPPL